MNQSNQIISIRPAREHMINWHDHPMVCEEKERSQLLVLGALRLLILLGLIVGSLAVGL